MAALVSDTLEPATFEQLPSPRTSAHAVCRRDEPLANGLGFEACYNALLDQLQVQIDQLSCQNAEKLMASGYEGDSDATSTPGCQTIMTKCPNVLVGLPQTK